MSRAFHVADEVDGQGFQQRGGGAGQFVTLMLLFADGKQADAGLGFTENDARINIAHHGELREHARGAIHVGADVDHHHRRSFQGGESGGERGTVNARHHALHHFRGGHDGAGIACGNNALRHAFAHQPEATRMELSRLVRKALAALSSMVTRSLACRISMGKSRQSPCCASSGAQLILAHQDDFHAESFGGLDGAVDFGLRGVIAAHCVNRDG